MGFINLLRKEKLFMLIIVFGGISYFRQLIVPLQSDEITYFKIASNILNGRYYLTNNPSTITPIVPLVFALFKTVAIPSIGFVFNKLFNMCLVVYGLRYVYLFLKHEKVQSRVLLTIIALTLVNPIAVAWFPSLYPESIIFFCFWGFIYYSSLKFNRLNVIKMLLFFLVLLLTRYVYAVLGAIVLYNYYEYLQTDAKKRIAKLFKYSLFVVIPVMLWAKYLYNIEQSNLSEISYFKRFKVEDPILYNIKCGLGIIKHWETSKINGIPAFISLFIPITGIRNYIASIFLILAFVLGYIFKGRSLGLKKVLYSLILVMLGFLFAGTGFSRYWVALLPGFYLGFYFLWEKLSLKVDWFVRISQVLCAVYIINEIRLDILIFNKFL